jgi:hypothetical protein
VVAQLMEEADGLQVVRLDLYNKMGHEGSFRVPRVSEARAQRLLGATGAIADVDLCGGVLFEEGRDMRIDDHTQQRDAGFRWAGDADAILIGASLGAETSVRPAMLTGVRLMAPMGDAGVVAILGRLARLAEGAGGGLPELGQIQLHSIGAPYAAGNPFSGGGSRPLGTAAFAALAAVLGSGVPALREMRLSSLTVDGAEFEPALVALFGGAAAWHAASLEELKLQLLPMGNEAVAAVAKAVGGGAFPALKRLCLECRPVNDSSLMSLSAATMDALAAALPGAPKLSSLEVSATIEQPSKQALMAACGKRAISLQGREGAYGQTAWSASST